MTFNIELSTRAARDLRALSGANRKLLVSLSKSINSLAAKPYSGKALKGEKKGCYSLRNGDYRIIYEPCRAAKTVLIIRVGNRKEIYR